MRVVAAIERYALSGAPVTTVIARPGEPVTVLTADTMVTAEVPSWRVVRRRGDLLDIHFFSGRGVIDHGASTGHHIYRWRITGSPGRTPDWNRDYVGYDGPDH